eukprot:TRINITY_DN26073_c0_g1_i1.p1 TRINITY_DN26073_c0_g1~~TRINITY_DN26073_c0_g1_i1.p1  ORF type:complete len:741 (-),score=100.23 TRINITY_DN26073_c0_g1_i1:166-2388(-)
MTRGEGNAAPKRSKAAHKRWLSDKRQSKSSAPAPEAPKELAERDTDRDSARPSGREFVARDLMTYYESQELFGTGARAAEEYSALWQTLRSPLPVTVVVDVRSAASKFVEARLSAYGWKRRSEFDKAGMSVWEIDDLRYSTAAGVKEWAERENRRGSLAFQELVSIVPALLLAPEPSHLCMDLCSAPGNKSVQLLKALESGPNGPTGAVVCCEVDAHRCCIVLQRQLAKVHSPAACAVFANASSFPYLYDGTSGTKLDISRILTDVPCSGDGTARKNTAVFTSWKRRESLELFSKQRSILMRAFALLAPGGILVYSTCSLNPLENEAVVLSSLRRWHRDMDETCHTMMELLDARAVCASVCGLLCDEGVTKWCVPAPERGGAIFARWDDVPAELRFIDGVGPKEQSSKYPLREEMFPAEDSSMPAGIARLDDLKRCARFYPQRNNTGGFFVAMFRKHACASLPAEPSLLIPSAYKKPQLAAHGRAHPLLTQSWERVRREDHAWISLRDYFGIDESWAEDKLTRGLLFWQLISGEISRLALVSPGVAQLFDACPADRKLLPWVRLGTFLFEQLPRNFLTGVARVRWQVSSEGIGTASAIVRRRVVNVSFSALRRILQAPHRQLAPSDSLLRGVLESSVGLLEGYAECSSDRGSSAIRHICGGMLLRSEIVDKGASTEVCVPAALTPQLLRLLVSNEDAVSLEELLDDASNNDLRSEKRLEPSSCRDCLLGVSKLWSVNKRL